MLDDEVSVQHLNDPPAPVDSGFPQIVARNSTVLLRAVMLLFCSQVAASLRGCHTFSAAQMLNESLRLERTVVRACLLSVLMITQEEESSIFQAFRQFFEDPSIQKVWHDYSFDRHIMHRMVGRLQITSSACITASAIARLQAY